MAARKVNFIDAPLIVLPASITDDSMANEDWSFFIETPPNSPCDYLMSAQPAVAQERIQTTQFTPFNYLIHNQEQTEDSAAHTNTEMETRVLIISNLGDQFKEADLPKIIYNPNTIIKSFEKQSNDDILVEFFDLHHAIQAKNYLNSALYDGVMLEVRFGPPRRGSDAQKPANNGTIVLFHLPPSITNRQLSEIFTSYGEIRQIRGTPAKPHQRFIEYWDVRCAELALTEMNGKTLIGSKISIEFSVPGGMRRKALE